MALSEPSKEIAAFYMFPDYLFIRTAVASSYGMQLATNGDRGRTLLSIFTVMSFDFLACFVEPSKFIESIFS